eukprot:10572464-Prorocentrum_lima.AAC.1
MLDPELWEALNDKLNNASFPITTPPGELVQSASSVGHAGVNGLRSRTPTPTLRTPPSPRERTSTGSSCRGSGMEAGIVQGLHGAQGYEPNQPHGGR